MHSPSVDRLETLYRVMQALGSTLHLDTLLNAVMDHVIEVTRAERGFLMLGGHAEELTFRVARGMDRKTNDLQRVTKSEFVNLMIANQRFRLPGGPEKIAAPTLVMAGQKEYAAMKQTVRDLVAALPHA